METRCAPAGRSADLPADGLLVEGDEAFAPLDPLSKALVQGMLRARRIPAYNYSGALPHIHFRGTPFLFHRMGFLKATAIRQVLETGRHVLVSDADVVWVRDPTAELEAGAQLGGRSCTSTR